MSKRMSGPVLLLLTLVFSLMLGDVLALDAQDPQTQPTTPQPQTQPTRPQTTKKKRGQVKKETTTGDQTAPAEPAAATEPATPPQTTAPAQTQAAMTHTEQTDLSGTYAGTFNCDALGLTGDTTLTINGNQFSTADGKTGRIVASTTRGYTAVAMQTGDVSTTPATGAAAAATTPPMIVSMRARKSGNRLTLTSVPGSAMPCSFGSARNVARNRRSRQKTPAATGTEVSMPNPAAPATQPAQPTTETPTTPVPSQTPSPEPSPSPVPTPSASPTPSGSPAPEPAPTASPNPTPSPTPTPSPSPKRGRPRG